MSGRRLYIATVRKGTTSQRYFFEGEDTPEADAKFGQVLKGIQELETSAEDWLGLLAEAKRRFAAAGFLRTAH